MKLSAALRMLLLGAGWIMCCIAVLAFLLCVLSAILSPFLDDPKGPGQMDIPYSLLAWASGFFSLIAGGFGFFILAITKGPKKKPNSSFDRISN